MRQRKSDGSEKSDPIRRENFGSELEYLIALNLQWSKEMLEFAQEHLKLVQKITRDPQGIVSGHDQPKNKCHQCPWKYECSLYRSDYSISPQHCYNQFSGLTASFSTALTSKTNGRLQIPESEKNWKNRLIDYSAPFLGGYRAAGTYKVLNRSEQKRLSIFNAN